MNGKRKVGYLILLSNIFLFIIKALAWFLTGSIAIKSESFNSFVDSLYSIIIITGFFASRRERTSEYPEGLVRLEPQISLFISGFIFITGSIIAYESITKLLNPKNSSTGIELNFIAYSVLIIGIVVKYIMYIYIKRKAKEFNSPSLSATAVDNRNDILTTSIAFVGVISVALGYPQLEAIAALIIAIYVSYSGVRVAEENIRYALGASVPKEIRDKIRESAMSNNMVHGIHDFEVHYTGYMVDVSMHLEIPGNLTVEEGHEIEIKVADKIRENCSEKINEINIHLDPESIGEWREDNKK